MLLFCSYLFNDMRRNIVPWLVHIKLEIIFDFFMKFYFRPTHFAESFANANAEIQSVFRMRIKYWKCINLLIISPNFAKLAHTAPRKWEVLPLNYTYKLVQLLLNILSLMELIIHWVPPEFCNNFLDFYMFF